MDVCLPPCASRRQRPCSSVPPNRSSPSSQTRPLWGQHQNGSAQSLRKVVKRSLKAIKAAASTRTTAHCGSVFSPQSLIPHPLHPFQQFQGLVGMNSSGMCCRLSRRLRSPPFHYGCWRTAAPWPLDRPRHQLLGSDRCVPLSMPSKWPTERGVASSCAVQTNLVSGRARSQAQLICGDVEPPTH